MTDSDSEQSGQCPSACSIQSQKRFTTDRARSTLIPKPSDRSGARHAPGGDPTSSQSGKLGKASIATWTDTSTTHCRTNQIIARLNDEADTLIPAPGSKHGLLGSSRTDHRDASCSNRYVNSPVTLLCDYLG